MGLVRVVAAALLSAVNLWLAQGRFVPLLASGHPAYALVSPSFAEFLAWFAGALAVLLALQFVVRRGRGSQEFFESTDHLNPLWWSALSLLPLLNLFDAIVGRIPALTYVFWELRWYWWLVLAVAVIRPIAIGTNGEAWWRLSPRAMMAALVIGPLAVAVWSTPHLRFSGVLHGDEPKYLRYAENFYQGVGFDVTKKLPLTEWPAGAGPRLWKNVTLTASALAEEAGLLIDDVRRLLGLQAPPRLVSGAPTPDLFFTGKHPGTLYQLHNPGISFLIFPGYLIDRVWTGTGVGYQNEFPAEMPALHVVLLALFAAYVVALHGFLLASSVRPAHAYGLAMLGAVALPAGAFAFQVYPEVAAGVIVLLLATELIAERPPGSLRLAVLGVLSGFLPWLHVRLGLVTAVTVVFVSIRTEREWRERLWFVAGAGIGLAALSAYTYRLTGSLIPLATYGTDAPLSFGRAAQGVPAFLIDRDWGLFAHAPIYLIAVAGLGLVLRERRRLATIVIVLFAAVAVPAAAHGFWAGGSTPGRYLVAGAPLLLAFAGHAWSKWSSSRLFTAVAIVTVLITLETAIAYNWHHVKEYGPLVAQGISGWRPNLLFPSVGMGAWTDSARELSLLAAWTLVLAGAVLAGYRRGGRLPSTRTLPLAAIAVVLVGVAVAGEAISAVTSVRSAERYVIGPRDARERVLETFAALPHCALCLVTGQAAGDPSIALDNDVGFVVIRVESRILTAGEPVFVTIRPRSAAGEYIVGTIRVDFGDGEMGVYPRQFADRVVDHVYARPGTYALRAWVRTADGRTAAAEQLMQVVVPASP